MIKKHKEQEEFEKLLDEIVKKTEEMEAKIDRILKMARKLENYDTDGN